MSQNEKEPENKQNQVGEEVAEQQVNSDKNVETKEEIGQVVSEEQVHENHNEEVNPETAVVAAPEVVPTASKATGWKLATGVLAAAVIGLSIYAFVPGSTSDTLAKVNGTSVSQADVFDKIVEFNYDYVAEIIEASIDEQVLEQELKAKSITMTDTDLQAELTAFRLKYPDQADFDNLLSYYGMTEEDLKNNLKQSTQIRLLLADTIEITDEKVSEYFETNKASLGAHGDRVRASHILVADEELAKEIITQLDAGADFASLAAQYGTDGTAQTGGDLGFFEKTEMIPVFSDATFAMEVDTYSKEPVASEYGFHVILKTGAEAAYEPTLENLKDSIKIELTNTEIYAQHPTYIDDLRAKGSIENIFSTTYPAPAAAAVVE